MLLFPFNLHPHITHYLPVFMHALHCTPKSLSAYGHIPCCSLSLCSCPSLLAIVSLHTFSPSYNVPFTLLSDPSQHTTTLPAPCYHYAAIQLFYGKSSHPPSPHVSAFLNLTPNLFPAHDHTLCCSLSLCFSFRTLPSHVFFQHIFN